MATIIDRHVIKSTAVIPHSLLKVKLTSLSFENQMSRINAPIIIGLSFGLVRIHSQEEMESNVFA